MPSQPTQAQQHVRNAWSDATADSLSPVERLVYRSNILGDDQRITNTGGGNTSSKIIETDPLTGEEVEVLWVKGSGGDLRTAKADNFASLYQDKLHGLQDIYHAAEHTGVKTPIEDKMVELYRHATFNLNPRASSIDTPLHAFVPYKHVDHMHPNAVIAIAASENGEQLTREVFGDEIAWVPWQRPGFDLGLKLQQLCKDNPKLKGAVLGKHGLINWADDDHACYQLTLELIEKAAHYIQERDRGDETFGGAKYHSLSDAQRNDLLVDLLPWLRGQVSQQQRFIGTVQADANMLRFVNSHDAARLAELGTSCPDHFLRTKIKPLYVDWRPQADDLDGLKSKLAAGIARYREDYTAYYESCKRDDSPPMRDPNPTVVLIPGVGMIAWGKDKSESRVTAEFYNCAVEVMRGAEAIDTYTALPQQEAFDIEYWWLEELKLRRKPAEKALARKIVAVVGAGNGVGKAAAQRLAVEGGHIVCADLSEEAAGATADELIDTWGQGIGVAGTGISACGRAIGVGVNVTDRESLHQLYRNVVLAYGGLDYLVVTAGVFLVPDTKSGQLTDQQWKLTFDVNVLGSYLAVQGAKRIFDAQGNLGSSVVLTTSVNGVVPKNGSMAYDTSKAAADHLVRELAIDLAPTVRVNAVAPATVVAGSTMFPRERVKASLAKYAIPFSEDESDEALRDKLAEFYAQRTLTKAPVTPADQAEAIYFLLSDASAKTTGQIINVDGGLHEAFLR